jgi:hypothetical protein
VATNDTATAKRGTTIHLDVLSNDFDSDGDLDVLSVSLVNATADHTTPSENSGPSVKTRNGRNEIDYRAPLVTGEFSFTYQVCDLAGTCRTADVHITVTV